MPEASLARRIESYRRIDHFAMPQGKCGAPTLAPCVDVSVVIGPSEMLGEPLNDRVEVQRRVAVIPTKHLKSWQVATVLRL